MKTIKQTYHIDAPIEKVWQALVDPKIVNKWGGGPAKMDEEVGTKFEFWGGDIWGKNIKVVKGQSLEQEWYGGKWKEPSIVTFSLKPDKNGTRVDLHHSNIPDDEVDGIDDGWNGYYLGAIKKLLEK